MPERDEPHDAVVSTVPQAPGHDDRRGEASVRSERLFEMSLDMLATASLGGYFTHLNPAWERTLGWTVDQLMACPFIAFVHPEDVAETLERVRELAGASGTEVVAFENRYRTSSGEFRSMRWDVVSDAEAFYCVARDVTEGRAAADRIRQDASVMEAVLESIADGLYVADSQRAADVHQSRRGGAAGV